MNLCLTVKVKERGGGIYWRVEKSLCFTLLTTTDRHETVRETQDFISKLKIPDGPSEGNLRSLTDECRRLAQAILEKLQSIKPATPQSKFGAIWSALRSERAQNELEKLEGRLGRCRDELSRQLGVMTR